MHLNSPNLEYPVEHLKTDLSLTRGTTMLKLNFLIGIGQVNKDNIYNFLYFSVNFQKFWR